jgi:S1-C subfamily serine protease
LFICPSAYAQIDFISNAVKINCNGSQGAGFWLEDRIIATAKHVVEKCLTANVENNDGLNLKVTHIEFSNGFDIAYLIVSNSSNLVKSPIISKELTSLGQTVYAVGAPIDGLVLSQGKLVGKIRNELGDWLEINIPADNGNSGGPVFSDAGVVGMLVSKDISSQSIYAYNFDSRSGKSKEYDIGSNSPLLTQVLSASIMFMFGVVIGITIGYHKGKSRRVMRKRIKIYV